MISQREFREITARKYAKMRWRAKPRYYTRGRLKGHVRVPERTIPFTLDQFRAWVMEQMGHNARQCFYCPRLIDVLHFEPDHFHPLELGGSFGLENLVPACEDCNNMKGAMPGDDFQAFMELANNKISQAGRDDLFKRVRAGAMGIRLRHHPRTKGKGENEPEPPPPPQPGKLDFF